MHRRQFFTAASLSLACVTRQRVLAANSNPIAAGQIGTKHAHAAGQMETMRRLGDFEVVGVVEPDDQQWQRVRDQAAYRDVRRLTEQDLLKEVQVVAVETEIAELLPTALRCLQAGKHVHIDKPAGDSLEQLQRVQAVAKQNSCTIQMGYMYRYNRGFEFLYDMIAKGWLGEVFEVHAVMSKTSGESARREIARYPGGAMFELGCHLIDPLIRIMGEPKSVTPYLQSTRADELKDNTLAVFEFPKATATVRSSLVEVDGFRRRQFVVCGDQGTLVIRRLEPPRVELTLAKARGTFTAGTQLVELPKTAGRYDGAWLAMAKTIRNETPLPFSHDHDYLVQRAILAASGMQAW